MESRTIWITIILTVQFSVVLGRNNYYDYYISRYHHKSHSTTLSLSSSTTDISSEEKTEASVSGDSSVENVMHSSTADFDMTVHKNETLLGYGSNNDGMLGTWIIIAIVLPVLIGFCLLLCCCSWCAKTCRRELKGFVMENNNPESARVLPEQRQLQVPHYTEGPPPQQRYQTQYHPQPNPYFFPVPPSYQNQPTAPLETHGVPESPPPPYEAPYFGAPPYRN